MVTILNLRITSWVFGKNLRNERTLRYQKIIYNYCIIAQKLGVTRTQALTQLSFAHFKPYVISLLELFLSIKLMSKSKKTLEMSLDLMHSFKFSVDTMVEGLVLKVNYLENWHHNFIKKSFLFLLIRKFSIRTWASKTPKTLRKW